MKVKKDEWSLFIRFNLFHLYLKNKRIKYDLKKKYDRTVFIYMYFENEKDSNDYQ